MPASANEKPLPSVWTRPQRPRREQPPLSREQIVSAAIRLLDAEGIDALSMRRLGAELNAGATSMYTHVANKDELIELVVDEVLGEVRIPVTGQPADWRAAATEFASSLRSTILQHPWIVSVLGEVGLAYLGPNMMHLADRILEVFEAGGFAPDQADRGMEIVTAYVIGIATSEAAWLTTVARSGQSERDWVERLWPAAEKAAQPYPRLRERYATQRGAEPGASREGSFGDGLDLILDGLETRLAGPKGRPG